MKVLIADDHPMVRDALARTLRLIEPAAEVLEAGDFAALVRGVEQGLPDLALVDLHMPGMEGVAGLRQLRERFATLKIVVVSAESDPALVRKVLGVGISGYLPKTESPEVHLHALRLVLSGAVFLPDLALRDFRDGEAPVSRPDASGLTPRQLDVLQLLMRGQANKVIARELGLAEGTVKLHIAAILRTLQARNRTEAVVMARELGIVAPGHSA